MAAATGGQNDFTFQAEALRNGKTIESVIKAGGASANSVPGTDFDVSKPVGATKALFPFGGMPRS